MQRKPFAVIDKYGKVFEFDSAGRLFDHCIRNYPHWFNFLRQKSDVELTEAQKRQVAKADLS